MAFAILSETTTLPEFGDMMREPSEFETRFTVPPPLVPQSAPVPVKMPLVSTCRHWIMPVISVNRVPARYALPETVSKVVEAFGKTDAVVEVAVIYATVGEVEEVIVVPLLPSHP